MTKIASITTVQWPCQISTRSCWLFKCGCSPWEQACGRRGYPQGQACEVWGCSWEQACGGVRLLVGTDEGDRAVPANIMWGMRLLHVGDRAIPGDRCVREWAAPRDRCVGDGLPLGTRI